ncbi:LysM domain-containing protein [Pleurostoma richardsiae]|uniref:LysM domain-containing protein n=1 Tax=Pleurostoma richardsiae TaxID=41990 RepID=A0AA38R9X6_9PEZI|nr:LysM domain-containing protein [Pleurostoma richardsiae]
MKISTRLIVNTALLGLHLSLACAYLTDPPTTADPNTVSDCSYWVVAASGDSCTAIAADYGISEIDFENIYNPSVGSTCKLNPGQSYCVERNYGIPPPTASTTTISSPTATSTGNGISTPTPTQSGMAANCNKFYLTKSGDSCANIASANGILLADFYTWNTGVGSSCQTLWADTYYCVGIIGQTMPATSTAATSTTSSSGNGITTPTPTQAGMTSSCNKFYMTETGDSCAVIASTYGISLSDFYAWNTGVGSNCQSLWADTYYCVGIIGQTTSPPTTTTKTTSTSTSSGNGISTPTPTQPGMTPNCDKFYFVQSGDGCASIASKFGITLSQFYAWNTGVGSNCEALWANAYVCVHAFN